MTEYSCQFRYGTTLYVKLTMDDSQPAKFIHLYRSLLDGSIERDVIALLARKSLLEYPSCVLRVCVQHQSEVNLWKTNWTKRNLKINWFKDPSIQLKESTSRRWTDRNLEHFLPDVSRFKNKIDLEDTQDKSNMLWLCKVKIRWIYSKEQIEAISIPFSNRATKTSCLLKYRFSQSCTENQMSW